MIGRDLQLQQSKAPIAYPKVLVVEGHDAFQFFKALLRHLNLLSEIEIRNSGGVNNWPVYLKTLIGTPGFVDVISLGVIRDAEDDMTAVFASVSNGLRQAQLSVPEQPLAIAAGKPKVSIFILPDCVSSGMLETLCLRAVSSDPVMPCVDDYFQCLQKQNHPSSANLPKARLHAFLASRQKPDLLLGQAAHASYWPWDNPTFESLKQFLRAL